VAEEEVTDADGVDRICEEIFLARKRREADDNLQFVRSRLLRSEGWGAFRRRTTDDERRTPWN
jgi:hypothetical protein